MKKGLLNLYLSALAAFAPFSTDLYLPAMPTIQKVFDTTTAHVQLTLSLFFVTFALGQLFWGPLSDRIGRKLSLFIGVIIFFIGSLLCAWSQSIYMLIGSRVLQALGACAGIVLAIAMVKDLYPDPQQMSKVLSTVLSVALLAPMVAPIVGSYLLVHIDWQANFYFLAIYGALLIAGAFFLQESHPVHQREPLPASQLVSAYAKQVACKQFIMALFAVCANFAIMFAFISGSPFIYINIYHVPAHLFGYYFAVNGAGLILGIRSMSFLRGRVADKIIVFSAATISTAMAFIMWLLLEYNQQSILCVLIPSFFITYGVGLLYPELMSLAMKHVVKYTGLTSSLTGAFRFLAAAITAFVMGLVITHSAVPMAIVMFVMGVTTLFFMTVYLRIAG